MNSNNDSSHQRFITSEMWAVNLDNGSVGWVETGHTVGALTEPDGTSYVGGYRAYFAYQIKGGGYSEWSITALDPNSDITDEFQISRGTVQDKWRVYFDGTLQRTPDVGFWSIPIMDVGGEVATSLGTSNLFTMSVRAITAEGSFVNWGNDRAYHVDDPPLYGAHPGESSWSWRIRP